VDDADHALGRAPLFEDLDDEGAKALRSMLTDVELPRGDRLFDEGEGGDRLYVVLEGKIKLTRAASDGRGSNSDSSPNISPGSPHSPTPTC
jgi:CRP/FNR family cyclic AMP-dependent transcriptional regulator